MFIRLPNNFLLSTIRCLLFCDLSNIFLLNLQIVFISLRYSLLTFFLKNNPKNREFTKSLSFRRLWGQYSNYRASQSETQLRVFVDVTHPRLFHLDSFLQLGSSKQKSGANKLHQKMQLIDPTWSFIDATSSMVFHI